MNIYLLKCKEKITSIQFHLAKKKEKENRCRITFSTLIHVYTSTHVSMKGLEGYGPKY